MATSFFGGNFFGGEFFNQGGPTPAPEETVTYPRPDDGPGRKTLKAKGRRIFKPTGLVDRPRTVQERVEQTAEIALEVSESVVGQVAPPPGPPPITEMTLREVEREIGMLLRKKMRTQEDELILLLLMAASAAG